MPPTIDPQAYYRDRWLMEKKVHSRRWLDVPDPLPRITIIAISALADRAARLKRAINFI